jgi:hypothetical protein
MPLAGLGVVAIWHDLTDEIKPAFYQWHNREHMPERLGIPGFNYGRRYIALSGTPQYFNLYEADSLDVVAGPAYLERLNNPTPWTQRTVPGFRNVSRSVCRVESSVGVGQGGVMHTVRFDAAPDKSEALHRFLVNEAIPKIAAAPGVAGAHFCRADQSSSHIDTTEKKTRGSATLVPNWVLMVEGVNQSFVEAARRQAASDEQLLAAGARSPIDSGSYLLEHARSKEA